MELPQTLFFALLLTPSVSTLAVDSLASQAKPNIVFILADDLGQRELFAWQKEVGAKSPEANKKFDPSKPNGRFAARPKSSTTP